MNITYVGDDKYAPVNVEDTLSVSKNNVTMNVSVSEPKVGENTVVSVDLPEDVYGTVTVQIGDITKSVAVAGGTNEIIIPDVPVGEHDVVVTFNENDKFASVTETSKVNVLPVETTADDIILEDSGNGTIKVTVPENATGNVTIKIDNETFTVPVVNGTATFNLTNLTNVTPGVHNVTVTYSGDENHSPYSYNTTEVFDDTPITLDIGGEGNNSEIVVNVPENTKGNVTVLVDGEPYAAVVDANGTVKIPLEDITPGDHNVTVIYEDANGIKSTVSDIVSVSKRNSELTVTSVDINVGEDEIIKITGPKGINGHAAVKLNGIN